MPFQLRNFRTACIGSAAITLKAHPSPLRPLRKHARPLPDRQPRRRTMPGLIGKGSARPVKARSGEQHPLDVIVARPQLYLVEVAGVGDDRVGGLFVGQFSHVVGSCRPLQVSSRLSLLAERLIISSRVDYDASKKEGALISPAVNRAQGGDLPEFFTEHAVLRLEQGLRAQREQQEGRLFAQQAPAAPAVPATPAAPAEHSNKFETQGPATPPASETVTAAQTPPREEPDAASTRRGSSGALRDWLIVSARIEQIRENPPLVPGDAVRMSDDTAGIQEAKIQNEWLRRVGDPRWQDDSFSNGAERPKIGAEGPVPASYWSRRKVGLLLCALLLVVGAAVLGVSLKARTGGSSEAARVNIEGRGQTAPVPRDNHELAMVVKPAAKPALPPLSPAPPNEQSVKAQGPTTPVASETPVPSHQQVIQGQRPATPPASETPAPTPQCGNHLCGRDRSDLGWTAIFKQPMPIRSGRRRGHSAPSARETVPLDRDAANRTDSGSYASGRASGDRSPPDAWR